MDGWVHRLGDQPGQGRAYREWERRNLRSQEWGGSEGKCLGRAVAEKGEGGSRKSLFWEGSESRRPFFRKNGDSCACKWGSWTGWWREG